MSTNDDNTPAEPDLRDDVEVEALTEAGGVEVGSDEDGNPLVEGPNPA